MPEATTQTGRTHDRDARRRARAVMCLGLPNRFVVARTGNTAVGGLAVARAVGHALKLSKQLTEQNAQIRSAGRWLRVLFTLSFSHQYANRPSEPHQRQPARIDSGRSKRIRVERANGSRRSWVVFMICSRPPIRRAAIAAKDPPRRSAARDASSELAYAERSAGSSGRPQSSQVSGQ